eukprot:CAMPEP_0179204530 /NCGR_PEP_ID=MMETSP0796-20121207/101960_1 /TAXON_ID=73915 /ORGANISM="Pyrodinium bahamense, Strain pbaha01" /LENGTH=34 /DNA_ID= /DNA_START= /DNA_END= /DNA_ORIENTATION=
MASVSLPSATADPRATSVPRARATSVALLSAASA